RRDIKDQSAVQDRLMRAGAESGQPGIVLLEIGKVFKQRLYTGWTEENDDVVKDIFKVGKIAYDRAEQYRRRYIIAILLKPVIGFFIGYVRTRIKKLFFSVFFQDVSQILGSLFSEKDFALTVLNIFLKIQCNGFRQAEVLHVGRYFITHFLTDAKEMVRCIPAGKDDSREIGKIDTLLFTYFAGRNALDMD